MKYDPKIPCLTRENVGSKDHIILLYNILLYNIICYIVMGEFPKRELSVFVIKVYGRAGCNS